MRGRFLCSTALKARQVCDDNNATIAIFTNSRRLVTKSEKRKKRRSE